MLHTKFHEKMARQFRRRRFLSVFTICGRGGHLGHVTQMSRTNFCSPYPRSLHIKFGFQALIGQVVSEKKMFEMDNDVRRTTYVCTYDGRTRGAWVSYKLIH